MVNVQSLSPPTLFLVKTNFRSNHALKQALKKCKKKKKKKKKKYITNALINAEHGCIRNMKIRLLVGS